MPPTKTKPKKPAPAPAKAKPKKPAYRAEIRGPDNPVTVAEMEKILGWEVEPEDGSFGEDFHLIDGLNRKVRLTRNKNRPLTFSWALGHAQKMLSVDADGEPQWQLNGETFIISDEGDVLSGQHRGVGFLLAEQIRNGAKLLADEDQSEHWKKLHPEPLTFQSFFAYGIPGTQKVILTFDNTKPRTFADAAYTHAGLAAEPPKARKAISRIIDGAIRMMWKRTGAGGDYNPFRNQAETASFWDRHPRLTAAAKHIWTEDPEGFLSRGKDKLLGIGQGNAAALLYLMAACLSDRDSYAPEGVAPSERSEAACDFSMWEKAEEFWTGLVKEFDTTVPDRKKQKLGRFAAVREAMAKMPVKEAIDEKMMIIVRAWESFSHDIPVALEDVELQYGEPDADGVQACESHAAIGGIDLGFGDTYVPQDGAAPGLTTDADESGDDPGEGDAGEYDEAGGDDAGEWEPVPTADPGDDAAGEAYEGDPPPEDDEPGEDEAAAVEARKAAVRAEAAAADLAKLKDPRDQAVPWGKVKAGKTYAASDGKKWYCGSSAKGKPVCDGSFGRAILMDPAELKVELGDPPPKGWFIIEAED